MKRIRFMILRNILIFPYLYIKLLILGKYDCFTEEQRYRHIRKITEHANKGGRVDIKSYGIENIPKQNGYILFPNHQGLYDVLTIIATHINPFSVVMKKELMKNATLSKVFIAMKAYAIDRNDIRQSMQVINQVSEDVVKGRNFLIFAEGTRSKEGNKIGEFKGGSFKSAVKAQCPIVPVALIDSYVPFDIPSIKRVCVKVVYLAPIYYEEYKSMKTTEIAKMVQNRIQSTIYEYEKK
ncbi:MAG: 1-acyl-sn-glycerol-3-phosphate acyltransferase [Lachnospiraceae bacterium]|nr:1-acyl-sn-glycerol-3-phosphate acyltransferase [Lachnospiraceae bacterium]